jgi:PAS domain-containing protein
MADKQIGNNPGNENTSSQTADQARLVIAVENTAEVIVITDIEGNIQYVNPAFEKITGYSRAEATAQNISLLDSGQHDPSLFRANVGLPEARRGLAGAIHPQEKR